MIPLVPGLRMERVHVGTRIRLAAPDDTEQILAIYSPYVRDTSISFELIVPTVAEMRSKITEVSQRYPWLVSEASEGITGYAYASRHRERAAYQWSVDVSVYIQSEHHGMGLGTRLYDALFKILVDQGYHNAYAGITLPNPASVALHEKMGFTSIGIYRGVGYKLNAWHDVGWWHLKLADTNVPPTPPKSIASLLKSTAKDAYRKYGILI